MKVVRQIPPDSSQRVSVVIGGSAITIDRTRAELRFPRPLRRAARS
jgi:hypothetical protein